MDCTSEVYLHIQDTLQNIAISPDYSYDYPIIIFITICIIPYDLDYLNDLIQVVFLV